MQSLKELHPLRHDWSLTFGPSSCKTRHAYHVLFVRSHTRPYRAAKDLVEPAKPSMQGQTDLNPTSAIGKLSQVVFAIISPGRVVANIVAGAIAEAGAQQAGDMMQVDSRCRAYRGV